MNQITSILNLKNEITEGANDRMWGGSRFLDYSDLVLVNDEGSGGQIYLDKSGAQPYCYKIQRPPREDVTDDVKLDVIAAGLNEISNCAKFSRSGITPRFYGLVNIQDDGRFGHAMEYFPNLRSIDNMDKSELTLWKDRIKEFEIYSANKGIYTLGDFELAAVSDSGLFDLEACRLVYIDLSSLHTVEDFGSYGNAANRHAQSFHERIYKKIK